ncbi:Uncharacterized protein TCM_010291 [Theobroma cacao]|uniref:Uncharacterized protein n=1 Tax=Theobroma cacao TaxID=3641 RepID=A0A061EDR0_THECC|nr:Uncharacterized protein TCM_010291 [Theobroma cacao]
MIWKMGWYAFTWTIWMARNDVVFGGNDWDRCMVFELIKTRVAWWINSKWPHLNLSFSYLARFLNVSNVPHKVNCVSRTELWTRPPTIVLKFNTNEATRGYPGEFGIGGILRNENGDNSHFL